MTLVGRLWVGAFALMSATALVAGENPLPVQSQQCLPADKTTARRILWLDSLMANGDSINTMLRGLFHLSRTASGSVRVISDPAACAKVAHAVDSMLGVKNSRRRMYVYRLGAQFGAEDPADTSLVQGDGRRAFLFVDSLFRYIDGTSRTP